MELSLFPITQFMIVNEALTRNDNVISMMVRQLMNCVVCLYYLVLYLILGVKGYCSLVQYIQLPITKHFLNANLADKKLMIKYILIPPFFSPKPFFND